MSFRHSLIALALAGALLAGCDKKEEAPVAGDAPKSESVVPMNSGAAEALEAQVQAFANNDFKTLLNSALPPKEIERMQTEWDEQRKEPVTEEQRKEFAESWGKITAPGGVDAIMAELEPQMVQLKPQLPGMIAMVQGMGTMSIQQSTELSAEQKTQASQFLNGLGGWLNKTDFADPALMRMALTALAEGLRATGINSLDEINALSFDQALEKAGPAFQGIKNALAAYGFSIDAMAKSVKTELISETGDTAKVRVTYSLFDSPQTMESELKKIDGRWYGKDMLEQIDKAAAEKLAADAAESQEPVMGDDASEGQSEDAEAESSN